MTRIALCTPLDRHSAIATSSVAVARELDRFADVTIFAEPTDHPIACPVATRPLRADAAQVRELQRFDHIVLVIGDSMFHAEAIRLAPQVSATLILHDHVLTHVVAALYGHGGLPALLHQFYPDEADSAAASLGTSTPFYATHEAARIPMTDVVLRHARGVVVHSEYSRNEVQPRSIAPIRVLPLPGFAEPRAPGAVPPFGLPDDAYVVASTGFANPNRQHERVIAALAHLDDLLRPVHFVIAGPVTEERRALLEATADAYDVGERVHILGRVSDAALSGIIERADVCVNLRYPALEGASASTLELLAHGRATIVCATGWYDELPDDTVVKVRPSIDPVSLAAEVRSLLTDPQERAALGSRARDHVRVGHGAESYARELFAFMESHDENASLSDTVNLVANATRSWGMPPSSPLAERTARTLLDMLGRRDA